MPLRISSVLWTNGASCNPYLWILSNLSQQTPLSVTLPTTFSLDRSHLFLPSLSIREKAVGKGWHSHRSTLLVCQGTWLALEPSPGMVYLCYFVSLNNGFPLHQLYLTTPSGEQECAWCWCCPACSEVTENKAMSQLATVPFPSLKIDFWNLKYMLGCPVSTSSIFFFEGQVIESQSKYVFKNRRPTLFSN